MARPAPDSHDIIVWRLDESGPPFVNSGTLGSGADLVAQVGSVTPGRPAIWGNGVQFPGTTGNYLRTADTTLGEVSPISMCAWVYPYGAGSGGMVAQKQIKTVAGGGSNTQDGSITISMQGFSYYGWRQQPILRRARPGTHDQRDVWLPDAPIQFSTYSQWYLLSGSYWPNPTGYPSGIGLQEVFLNGMQAGFTTQDCTESINWGSHGPWIIGNTTVNSNYGFNGIIGEIRISDVYRPPSYWRQYYIAGVPTLTCEELTLDPTKPRSMLPVEE